MIGRKRPFPGPGWLFCYSGSWESSSLEASSLRRPGPGLGLQAPWLLGPRSAPLVGEAEGGRAELEIFHFESHAERLMGPALDPGLKGLDKVLCPLPPLRWPQRDTPGPRSLLSLLSSRPSGWPAFVFPASLEGRSPLGTVYLGHPAPRVLAARRPGPATLSSKYIISFHPLMSPCYGRENGELRPHVGKR